MSAVRFSTFPIVRIAPCRRGILLKDGSRPWYYSFRKFIYAVNTYIVTTPVQFRNECVFLQVVHFVERKNWQYRHKIAPSRLRKVQSDMQQQSYADIDIKINWHPNTRRQQKINCLWDYIVWYEKHATIRDTNRRFSPITVLIAMRDRRTYTVLVKR